MCQVLSPLLCCFKAGETVEAASWLEVSSSLMLHSSHLYYVQLVAEKLNAFFWKANHGILHMNLKMLIMECIHTWKLAFFITFWFCWPYYSYCVCNWNILHIQRFNWETYWWITVYQVHCDRFKCLFWFNSGFINLDTFSASLAWNNWLCCKNSLLNNFKMHIKFWTFYFLS